MAATPAPARVLTPSPSPSLARYGALEADLLSRRLEAASLSTVPLAPYLVPAAACDAPLVLHFFVGSRRCRLSLDLQPNADLVDLLQDVMHREALPPSYLPTLLSVAVSCLDEAARQRAPRLAPPLGGAAEEDTAVDQWASRFSLVRSTHRPAGVEPGGGERSAALALADAFHSQLHSGKGGRALRRLEDNFERAVAELLRSRDAQLERLRRAQEQEMTQLAAELERQQAVYRHLPADSKQAPLQRLVERHRAAAQQLLDRWRSELAQLKESQRNGFREFVMSAADADADVPAEDEFEDAASTAAAAAASDKPSPHRVMSGDTQSSDFFGVILNSALGRPRTHGGATPEKQQQASQQRVPPRETGLRALDSFTVNLGQQGTPFNLRFLAGPLSSAFTGGGDAALATALRTSTSMFLYSSTLTGVVLLTDDAFAMRGRDHRRLGGECESSTEFHFLPVEEQVRAGRTQLGIRGPGDKVPAGSILITKHSTLSNAHLIFHLADLVHYPAYPELSLAPLSPVLQGLKNLLRVACLYDVAVLSLPLLLLADPPARVEVLASPKFLQRCEMVIKCVRSFLLENKGMQKVLHTVQFIVPPQTDAALQARYSRMLQGIFKLTSSGD